MGMALGIILLSELKFRMAILIDEGVWSEIVDNIVCYVVIYVYEVYLVYLRLLNVS